MLWHLRPVAFLLIWYLRNLWMNKFLVLHSRINFFQHKTWQTVLFVLILCTASLNSYAKNPSFRVCNLTTFHELHRTPLNLLSKVSLKCSLSCLRFLVSYLKMVKDFSTWHIEKRTQEISLDYRYVSNRVGWKPTRSWLLLSSLPVFRRRWRLLLQRKRSDQLHPDSRGRVGADGETWGRAAQVTLRTDIVRNVGTGARL